MHEDDSTYTPVDDVAREIATMNSDRFGDHVRSLRIERELTPEALAERSGLTVTQIERIEANAFSPPLDVMRRLCVGLELELSTLFDGFESQQANRRLLDAVNVLTEDQRRALLEFLQALRGPEGSD